MKIASTRIICGLMIATALLGFAAVFRADVAKAAAPTPVKQVKGDLNGDGHVNIGDVIILANAFESTNSSLNWNPFADLNGDGVINILDMILLASLFGSS